MEFFATALYVYLVTGIIFIPETIDHRSRWADNYVKIIVRMANLRNRSNSCIAIATLHACTELIET